MFWKVFSNVSLLLGVLLGDPLPMSGTAHVAPPQVRRFSEAFFYMEHHKLAILTFQENL